MSEYGSGLFDQHAAMLTASGITAEHARARGYVSVDTKARLERLGVTPPGRRVPGLLVPQLRVDGSTWGYQYRPDSPRERSGKPVKYETPTGQRNGLDVPPGVGAKLVDPAVPLLVTEGVKKADAAAVRGLACVALPGVWSWRGGNQAGGKTAISDWHDVALNGRRVVLAFDSDVVAKGSVHRALAELAGYLTSKGARVEYLHLPHAGDGKTGLDDWLVEHDVEGLWTLVRSDPPEVVEPAEPAPVSPVAPLAPVTLTGAERTGAPLNGRALLGELWQWWARFVCTLGPADLAVLTLWAAHTHLVTETYTTPRLLLDSPVPGSGKTTVLEHLSRLCHRPVQMAAVSSSALLTRMLEQGPRTLLIDEADRALRPDRPDVADLLAVLNSGYKRGAARPVLVPHPKEGWRMAEMPTFAPVAMAGNSPNLPDDTRSRTLRVLLLPDVDGSVEESDWELYDGTARELGERLASWAEQVRESVQTNRPPMPPKVIGRARERWAPLKRVAVAAGGHWPAVVDQLAVEDVERIQAEREEGIVQQRPAVVVLTHIHAVWPDGETFLPTEKLVSALIDYQPETWGSGSAFGKALTHQRLGRMLVGSYGVHSTRQDRTGPRGYVRAAFDPAWRRMRVGVIDPAKQTGASGATGETGALPDPTEHTDLEADLPQGSTEDAEPPAGLREVSTEDATPACTICGGALFGADLLADDGICTTCAGAVLL